MKRKTLKNVVEYDGIGLHKGEVIKMKLIPSKSTGIVFRMMNMPEGKNEILLDYRNTFDLTRGTNLKNEVGSENLNILSESGRIEKIDEIMMRLMEE